MRDEKHVAQPLTALFIPTDDAHQVARTPPHTPHPLTPSHPPPLLSLPSLSGPQSEYIADCDKRREFISGFTGSAGVAIVTADSALLWTDGRYHLQASQQLPASWTLMKQGAHLTPLHPHTLTIPLLNIGNQGVPSIEEWLSKVRSCMNTEDQEMYVLKVFFVIFVALKCHSIQY